MGRRGRYLRAHLWHAHAQADASDQRGVHRHVRRRRERRDLVITLRGIAPPRTATRHLGIAIERPVCYMYVTPHTVTPRQVRPLAAEGRAEAVRRAPQVGPLPSRAGIPMCLVPVYSLLTTSYTNAP